MAEVALEYNAFTNHDVTHYTSTAFTGRLPELLELEAQRLETTYDQIDDDVFSRERDVVLEEEAERRTSWSDLFLDISREVWGNGHPYSRAVNSREVADVTRAEACRFLDDHYTPEHLSLVITGDFDAPRIASAIAARFTRISSRAGAPQAPVAEARLAGTRSRHRGPIDDATAFLFFPAPRWGGPGTAVHLVALERLRGVLRRLDREHGWITGAAATTMGAGRSQVVAVLLTVDEPKRLDDAVEEVLKRAPSMFEDIDPFRYSDLLNELQAERVERYESFAERAAWLADYLNYTRHNAFMVEDLTALNKVALPDVTRYAKETFVRSRSHVAMVEPNGQELAGRLEVASGRELDLAPWRAPADASEARRPVPLPTASVRKPPQEILLLNGLRVLMTPDPGSAQVDARLVLPHGSLDDPPDRRGLATAAAHLLEANGDLRMSLGQHLLFAEGASVGTQLSTAVDDTSTVFTARGLAHRAEWHVWRLYWLVEQCIYTNDSVNTLRDDFVRDDGRDADPAAELSRRLLFGEGHPLARPRPTAGEWRWLSPEALEGFREAHYLPGGATLIITGGFDVERMTQHVRSLFAPWEDKPGPPPQEVPEASPAPGPGWVGMRDPSQTQVGLRVDFATASQPDRDRAARRVLGELIEDRLRIVREGMGASYGVRVSYGGGTGASVLEIESELDPQRAVKAATAILSELEAIHAGVGTMDEDFVRARRRALAQVLADASGVTAVANELEYGVRHALPVDHFARLARSISELTPAAVAAVAAADLDLHRRVTTVTANRDRLDKVMAALGATGARILDKPPRHNGRPSP
jgi:zinc protease